VTPMANRASECNSNGGLIWKLKDAFAALRKRPEEYFTGTVRVDPLFDAADPARARGASVTFEPSRDRVGIRIRSARR